MMMMPVVIKMIKLQNETNSSVYLAGVVQSLPHNKVDGDPGNGQVCHQFPSHAADIIDARANFQDSIAGIKGKLKIFKILLFCC